MDLLREQLRIQLEEFGNPDPSTLEGDELADWFIDHTFALEHELHEAISAIRWKFWLKQRGIPANTDGRERLQGELGDAYAFLLNLLLAAGIKTQEDLEWLVAETQQKNVERRRQGDER